MIKQYESSVEQIQRYGCFFMAIISEIARASGHFFDDDEIRIIYKSCCSLGWITENCYITKFKAYSGIAEVAAELIGSPFRLDYIGETDVKGHRRETWGQYGDICIIEGKVIGTASHFFTPHYNPDPSLEIEYIISVRHFRKREAMR